MIRDKKVFFIGLFLFIIPFLGLPLWWKLSLVILVAIVCMVMSLDRTKIDFSKFSQISSIIETLESSMPVDSIPSVPTIPIPQPPSVPQSPPVMDPVITVERPKLKRVYRPRPKKTVVVVESEPQLIDF